MGRRGALSTILGASVLSLLLGSAPTQAAGVVPIPLRDDQYAQYVTEPNFRFIKMKAVVTPDDASKLDPGYIFLAPFYHRNALYGYGPQIVDQSGELVWLGKDVMGHRAQNFHVCQYNSSALDHLCWSEGYMNPNQSIVGLNRVVDSSYQDIGANFSASAPLTWPNPHEMFSVYDGKTFMNVVYEPKARDLTPYNGTNPGWISDGCFQEIDYATGEAVFSWCGLDHLYEWESYIYLDTPRNVANHTGEPYGNGSYNYPWDYFHINSAEKMRDGNYVISARHLNQVLKIAGNTGDPDVKPGSIMWRLGGKFNTFNYAERADLSRQHHVRVLDMNATHTTLSVFNNQWQVGKGSPDRRISNVQKIVLNEQTMEVESAEKFFNPEGHVSVAQGSAQVLPNGNMFAGWGTVPQFTEWAADGTLLHHMHLAPFSDNARLDDTSNYRAFKFNWVGRPTTTPKILAYAQSCNDGAHAPLVAHVSWNGATEVRSWRFSTAHDANGPWFAAGTFPKSGFETTAHLSGGYWDGNATFSKFVRVEALDAKGRVLSAAVGETFVPDAKIAAKCSAESCADYQPWFTHPATLSCAGSCRSAGRPGTVLFFLFIAAAGATLAWRLIRRWRNRASAPRGNVEMLPAWMPSSTADAWKSGKVYYEEKVGGVVVKTVPVWMASGERVVVRLKRGLEGVVHFVLERVRRS